MRPRQAGVLQILLNFLVHETERERGVGASVQAREFDHMTNSSGLARVYERALRFDHVHGGSRDHEDSMNAVQSRRQAARSGHIALNDLNSRVLFEPSRLCPIPHQHAYGHALLHKLLRYEGACRTRSLLSVVASNSPRFLSLPRAGRSMRLIGLTPRLVAAKPRTFGATKKSHPLSPPHLTRLAVCQGC